MNFSIKKSLEVNKCLYFLLKFHVNSVKLLQKTVFMNLGTNTKKCEQKAKEH